VPYASFHFACGPRYDVLIAAPGMPLEETAVRALIARHPAHVELMQQTGPQQAAVRLTTAWIYDVVVTLEAAGLEVVRVVATDSTSWRRLPVATTTGAEFNAP